MAEVKLKISFDAIDTTPIKQAAAEVSKWKKQATETAVQSEKIVQQAVEKTAKTVVDSERKKAASARFVAEQRAKLDSEVAALVAANAAKRAEKEAKLAEAQMGKLHELSKRQHAAQLQMGDSLFKVAQGFTTLGVLGEENTAKLIRNIAAVHAAYDVLSGASRIGMGLKETSFVSGMIAKTKGGGMAAGAAGAVAGSTIANAGTGAAGAVGGVLGSPAVLAAVGVAAVVAGKELYGLAKTMDEVRRSTEKLSLAQSAQAKAVQRAKEVAEQAAKRAAYIGLASGMQATLNGYSDRSIEQQRADIANRQQSEKQREEEARKTIELMSRPVTTIQQRDRTLGEYGVDWLRYVADVTGQPGGLRQGEMFSDKRQVETTGAVKVDRTDFQNSLTRQVEMAQELADAEKRNADTLRQNVESQRQITASMRDQVKAADELVRSEKDRYQSQLARFGAMTKTEQEEIRRISEKYARGEEVSLQEAATIQKSGMADKVATGIFAAGGAKEGGGTVMKNFNEDAGLKNAMEQQRMANENLAKAETDLVDTNKALDDAMSILDKAVRDLADRMNEALHEAGDAAGEKTLRVRGGVIQTGQQMIATLDELLDGIDTISAGLESRRARASAWRQAVAS